MKHQKKLRIVRYAISTLAADNEEISFVERKGKEGNVRRRRIGDDVAKGDAYVIDAKHHFQFGSSVRDS